MKLIIFDIDGTLTDTLHLDDSIYLNALKDLFNIELTDQEWQKHKLNSSGTDSGVTISIFLDKFNRLPEEKELIDLENLFIERFQIALTNPINSIKEIPKSTEFFNYIAGNKNYIVGVATGSWKVSGELKLKAIGINSDSVIYGNASLFSKRSDILSYVIQTANKIYGEKDYSPVYFGDGLWDLRASNELGIDIIGVDYYNTGVLKEAGCQKIINNYGNIEEIIKLME